MIQDTSFVVDLLRGDDGAVALLETIEAERRPQKVSAVTVLELYEGVIRSGTPAAQRQSVLDVLDSKHVVSADHEVLPAAGELSGRLIANGDRIEREECVIAATALSEGGASRDGQRDARRAG